MAEDLIDYELDGDAPDDIEPIQGEPELYEHFRTVVDKGQAPVRIDKYLFERIVNASRNRIQMAADNGFVMVNGKPVKSSYKVKPLDVLTVMMDRPRYENDIIPEDIPLNIVYEDDDLMVINKPAGLVVHPGCGNYHGTLVNAIAWHLRDVPTYNPNDPQVGLVHRIDKDTSGLLVVAKTPDAKTSLGLQFYNKTTKREYNALVWGIVEQDEGTITGNIGRNPRDRMQMAVMSDPEQGKHAVTHYQVLERLGYVTLVKCVLETGRTHQIRVHMKHIGHTLFNDERYGGHEILMDMNFSLSTDGVEGLTLLKQVKLFLPEVPVILMTAWGSIELAVQGMQAGAFDFITKPWQNILLMQRIETALKLTEKKEEEATVEENGFDRSGIIGKSKALTEILKTVQRIAPTTAPVLIMGESGTGKELIAEAIHRNSQRCRKPFVKVNLGGISQSLFESEMFGHKKGAFTDAATDRIGRFEMADKGTIFLDELGELDLSCQVKMLRVLQEQTFEVLGDSRPRKVDVRVVCATNANLAARVQEKTFREDLFYRVNLITIHLPALLHLCGGRLLQSHIPDVYCPDMHTLNTLSPSV